MKDADTPLIDDQGRPYVLIYIDGRWLATYDVCTKCLVFPFSDLSDWNNGKLCTECGYYRLRGN